MTHCMQGEILRHQAEYAVVFCRVSTDVCMFVCLCVHCGRFCLRSQPVQAFAYHAAFHGSRQGGLVHGTLPLICCLQWLHAVVTDIRF